MKMAERHPNAADIIEAVLILVFLAICYYLIAGGSLLTFVLR